MPLLGVMPGRVHRQWRTTTITSVKPLGITEARWTVLVHLSKLGEGCTQHALATDLGIEMPSLSRTLSQLDASIAAAKARLAANRADAEETLRSVEEGDTASVIFDAYPGRVFDARVVGRVAGVKDGQLCHAPPARPFPCDSPSASELSTSSGVSGIGASQWSLMASR